MGYVWMKDVPQVQTVGAGGIGMSPPTAVHMPEKVDEKGKYQEASGAREEIPNPGAAGSGKVIKESNGLWAIGDDEAGSGSGSGGSESGSGVGNLVVHTNMETGALDKTWQEIYDAFSVGAFVAYVENVGTPEAPYLVQDVVTEVGYTPEEEDDGGEMIYPEEYYLSMGNLRFTCASSTGYPSISGDCPN